MPKIAFWDKYPEDHWLREYGRTQVIVIDDQWYSDSTFGVPSKNRKVLEKKFNVTFHYFKPPDNKNGWDKEWFLRELNRTKNECKNPSAILLDLMFGSETDPLRGSGKKFLKILSDDALLSEIPVLIITAGQEDNALLEKLKSEGGSLQDFLGKYYPSEKPFSNRLESSLMEYALISDPNIHAYSYKMRKVVQSMRKVLLDSRLKERIKEVNIPMSVLFIGNSGDGKNYLAEYLQEVSDRREKPFEVMTFSDITEPADVEPMLFGSLPWTGFEGKSIPVDSRTGQRNPRGDIGLAIVGMVTNVDTGTLLLDELGNSPAEMQTKLLRFLDKREISPRFYNKYIPIDRPYNVWVLMTMQPQHSSKLKDLDRRMNKMIRIDVPSLKERAEDVIPIAASMIDEAIVKSPQAVFTEDAINWLKEKSLGLTAGNLTSVISKLSLESSIYPYNAMELERAFTQINDKGIKQLPLHGDVKQEISGEPMITPQSQIEDNLIRDKKFEEKQLASLLTEQSKRIVNYILQALEIYRDKSNGDPNYPQTWMAMTGDTKKRNSSEYQRFIGNYIFQLPDEEIVSLMERSEVFSKAVLQCGSKVQSAKKRLAKLKAIK